MPFLHFESSTNIKDLVGRRLVTNKISAIFELVKNSFDADAESVTISLDIDNDTLTISDNGKGMSLSDIKTKWMVIGTDNKKGVNYTEKGRPINGEKGIGRFSVDRLGRYLTLISSTGKNGETIKMEFDWQRFEDQKDTNLNQIEIEYVFLKTPRDKGVDLIISGLRDIWSKPEIESLERKLRGLLSPFPKTYNDFKIILDCKKFGYVSKELEPYNLKDISSLWIDMKITKEDSTSISYSLYRNGVVIEEKTYPNPYNFGPVKLIVYSFNENDKRSFYYKFNEHVKNFGNIRIYRDYFQIYPYGENDNDWLGIDIRKAQGVFRNLGVRDLIGYIQIYREHNPDFIDATNRQGLEENQALEDLRTFFRKEVLPKLEEYFFLKKFKTEEKEHVRNREDITKATKSLNAIAKDLKRTLPEKAQQVLELTKIIQENNQKQDKIIRNQQQLVEVYKRIASKETLLHGIIHQVLIRLQNVEAAVWNQRDDVSKFELPSDLHDLLEESQDFILSTTKEINDYLLSARNYILRKREKITINLYDQLQKVFNAHKHSLENEKINYTIIGSQSINMKFDLNDFKVIFENLISNSKKSLAKVHDRPREIEVKFEVTAYKLNIFFKDNGVGIEKNAISHIFTPFYTTTDGYGMGLAIVDELVKTNNGEINLIKPVDNEPGATFQLSFNLGG
ncbi:sensor histidine kinase [Brevibacillus sp. SYP-B805]|uniref:sensor histidine kinase n=1 Tax=Brevibacillus sp. SYP-B805 TaxID=1578199 RepID=UPI0013EB5301|nr:sensor histidine kinase [Brevibacillus sp. SYP-B805]NGQ95417.1 sensor histidine kinase [Brevibacillus sp. SYP-B805]